MVRRFQKRATLSVSERNPRGVGGSNRRVEVVCDSWRTRQVATGLLWLVGCAADAGSSGQGVALVDTPSSSPGSGAMPHVSMSVSSALGPSAVPMSSAEAVSSAVPGPDGQVLMIEPGQCPAPWVHCDSYQPPAGCRCETGGPLTEQDCAEGEQFYCEQRPAWFSVPLETSGGVGKIAVACQCRALPMQPSDCLHPGQFTCASYEPFEYCACNGAILPTGVCDPPRNMRCENVEVPYGCRCL